MENVFLKECKVLHSISSFQRVIHIHEYQVICERFELLQLKEKEDPIIHRACRAKHEGSRMRLWS